MGKEKWRWMSWWTIERSGALVHRRHELLAIDRVHGSHQFRGAVALCLFGGARKVCKSRLRSFAHRRAASCCL